ncbi:MAG TPA: DUF2079 domain-containing protein [Nitrososphaerales archaeon]|nr:DUF2079 domain-containing protein [Nitrososphaerales archaeon]
MTCFVLLRFYTFRTDAFDLGIFNQAFSTALKGKLFYETPDQLVIQSGSFLGTHFNLLMFLLLPIYALFPFAQTLLILQTVAIAMGAVPIYLIARRVLGKSRLPLILSLAYLINPAIISMNLYDFHLEAFLPLFLGMFYYCYIAANWKGYIGFLSLALVTVDFGSVMVCAICLAHLLGGLSFENGSLHFRIDRFRGLILVSTILVATVSLYMILLLSGVLSGTTTTVPQILGGFLGTPLTSQTFVLAKVEFWYLVLVTLAFVPLLAPSQLIMVAPWFVATLFRSNSLYYSYGYQFAGAFVVPYLLIASIHGLAKVKHSPLPRIFLTGILVFAVIASPFNPLTQGHLSGIAYEQGFSLPNSHDSILDQAVSYVPVNASVLTQNSLFTQLSNRADAYVLLVGNKTSMDYVLADTLSPTYSQVIWNYGSMKAYLPLFLSSDKWGIMVNDDGVILLKRGYSGPVLLSGPTSYSFDYRTLDLASGSLQKDATSVSGTILVHLPSFPSGGTFWFGPYTSLPPGKYEVTFRLKSSVVTNGSLTLEVSNYLNSTAASTLADEVVTPVGFAVPNSWTSFSMSFNYTPAEAKEGSLEFRGVAVYGGPFSLDNVVLTYLSPY